MHASKTANQPQRRRKDILSHWVSAKGTSETRSLDKAFTMFQPDILTAVQFRATYERTFHLESEKILMLAVLHDAVACFQDNLWASEGRKKQLFLDANHWLMEENASYSFSFDNICDWLGLDAGYVRQGLLKWKESALAARATESLTARSSTGTNQYKKRPSAGPRGRTTTDHGEKRSSVRTVDAS